MITFNENENWCRWNDILMSPKNCEEIFGTSEEFYGDFKDVIISYEKDTIYTDLRIGDLILWLGDIYKAPEKLDYICSQSHVNWPLESFQEEINGKVLLNRQDIDLFNNIKPMNDFKKDYPNFNKEKYFSFYNELDQFYEQLRNT